MSCLGAFACISGAFRALVFHGVRGTTVGNIMQYQTSTPEVSLGYMGDSTSLFYRDSAITLYGTPVLH